MSRKTLLNHLGIKFDPSTSEVMAEDLIGKKPQAITLVAQTTFSLDFSESSFIELTTGSQNLTALNAITVNMKDGEEVFLKITQGSAARTIAWGTGFIFAGGSGPTVTASANAIDLFRGIVTDGEIVLRVVAQNIS